MGWNAKYALLLLFVTIVTFVASLFIEKTRSTSYQKTTFVLVISLVAIFALVFYYKYLNFTFSLVSRFFNLINIGLPIKQFDIILPVGISFFTFQAAGYFIDVYRGNIKAERNFFDYALFVSFFPQLVAGPIERSNNLIAQLKQVHTFDFQRAKSGLFTMLYGYSLKMIVADRAALLVDFVFSNVVATGIQIAFATFIFAFQIYCDFSGYSLIAIGAAKILGINLMENFNAPYFSISFKDFWSRWHISLSSWFRDYLYIPLGGNKGSKFQKMKNTFITMLVSGLWHGAALHFVAWGFLHFVFNTFDSGFAKIKNHLPKIIQMCITFPLICFAWLFFRADSLSRAFFYIRKIFFDLQLWSFTGDAITKYGINGREVKFLLVSIFILMAFDFFKYKGYNLQKKLFEKKWYLQSAVFILGVLAIAIFGVWGSEYNENSFIYFQF